MNKVTNKSRTIRISEKNAKWLESYGNFGDSWNSIISRIRENLEDDRDAVRTPED